MKAVHTARRLMIATGIALCVGFTLACGGGATTDGATDAANPPPVPEPAADPAKKLVGTWKILPPEERMRELRIIDAAISPNKPEKKEKLGKLTPQEQKVFDAWKGRKGPDVRKVRQELRFLKNCSFEFTDSQIKIQLGDEILGPVPYTVVSATDKNTTIKFDAGPEYGLETHSFDWTGPNKGIDNISTSNGDAFILTVVRR